MFKKINKNLASERSGNVAIVFALAAIPIMAVVATSIDYGRAASIRSKMQAAADAATLMVAKDASELSQSQIQERATKYFLSNLSSADAKGVSVKAVYTPNAGNGATVVLTATAKVDNEFAKFVGSDSTALSASSTATWGNARMRIALSLDVTGSMADAGKITALRDAVTKFIDDMSKQSTSPGNVLISIVPFAKDVNVGISNKSASWVSFDDWDTLSSYCSIYPDYLTTKSSCEYYRGSWLKYNRSAWQGCVTDRAQPADIASTAPSSAPYPAEYYSECATPMMGLSSDWVALKAKVAALLPAGNTNQPIGIAMAWQTLLSSSPWPAPAKASDATYIDAIIHLSDGENTQNRWSTTKADIDARQASLCQNVKNNKIILYMIQVNTDGQPTQTVMKNCASSSDKFYMLTSGTQTVATFADIGKQLSQLRISQ